MARISTWTALVILASLLGRTEATAQELGRPRIDINVTQADLSFEELQRLVPALERVKLPADFHVDRLRASGPLTSLTIDFLIRSRDSELTGIVTANVAGPARSVKGTIQFRDVNLARLLDLGALPTSLTAMSTFDLAIERDPTSITGTYAVTADRLEVAGYSASDVYVAGRSEREALFVERARARAYGGSFTAEGSVVLPLGGRPFTYALSGRAANVDLRRLPGSTRAPNLQTSLAFTYELADRGDGLTGRALLDESPLSEGYIEQGTVVTFDLTGERIRYSADGRVRGIDPRRIGQALEIEAVATPRFAGTINGSFSLDGVGTTLRPVKLRLTDSKLFDGTFPQMDATISLLDDEVRFTAAGHFDGIDAGTIAQDASIEATLTGSLDVAGAWARSSGDAGWRNLSLDGRVQLTDGRVEGIPIEKAALSGSLSRGVIELERLDLDSPALGMTAKGTLALDGVTPSTLDYHIAVQRLTAFDDLIGDVEGGVILDGQVTGTETLEIQGTLAGIDLAYGGVAIETLNGQYDVSIAPGAPAAARVNTRLTATLIRIAGRTLTEATVEARYAERRATFDARVRENDRTITSTGDLFVQPGRQQVSLTAFRFEAPSVLWQMPPDHPARFDVDAAAIVVDDFQLAAPGGQAISVDGVIGRTTNEGPLEVRIEGLALSDLDKLVLGEQGMAGRVDAVATLRGPLALPQVNARFSVRNGAIRGFMYERLAGTVDSTEDVYDVSLRLDEGPASWLTAEGTLPRSLFAGGAGGPAKAEMDLVVRSSPLRLGLIGGFTDAVRDVEGTLEADLRVKGTPKQPSFDGRIAIRGGAFLVPVLGTRFTGLDTDVVFERDAMVVPEFHLLDENGESLRFAGRLPYTAGRIGDVTVAVDSENFEVVDNDVADIQVSTHLNVTGTLFAPRVQGLVRVTAGHIRADEILDLRQDSYYRVAPVGSADDTTVTTREPELEQEASGLLAGMPVALDVQLELPALVITGRNLRGPSSIPLGLGDINLTVEGTLQLDKAIDRALTITGDISTVRGIYEFQGRRFEIARDGTIQFPGLVEINPLLNVTAQRTISGVETRVNITGTLRHPDLTLSSQPPLDEADILSLIIFNQPANQLGAVDRVSLGDRAAALATGFVASKLGQSIAGALDIDFLEIAAGGVAGDGLAPSLTVGEQFGGNLFLRARQQFGPSSASELTLEYELTDWLRLQSTFSDRSNESQTPFRRGEQTGLNWIFSFSY